MRSGVGNRAVAAAIMSVDRPVQYRLRPVYIYVVMQLS